MVVLVVVVFLSLESIKLGTSILICVLTMVISSLQMTIPHGVSVM